MPAGNVKGCMDDIKYVVLKQLKRRQDLSRLVRRRGKRKREGRVAYIECIPGESVCTIKE